MYTAIYSYVSVKCFIPILNKDQLCVVSRFIAIIALIMLLIHTYIYIYIYIYICTYYLVPTMSRLSLLLHDSEAELRMNVNNNDNL